MDPERLTAELDGLRRLARTLVGDVDRAEDLVQDTFRVALESPAERVVHLRAWLRLVMRRRWRDVSDAARRRTALEERRAAASLTSSVDDLSVRLERHRILVEEVQRLEPLARDIVVLRFFDGLPPRRIATRLQLTRESVKGYLKRALARLRERLEHRLGEAEWREALWPIAFGVGGGLGSATFPSILFMGLFMKAKLVAILAILGLAFWMLGRSSTPDVSNSTALELSRESSPSLTRATASVARTETVEGRGEGHVDPSTPASLESSAEASGLRFLVLDHEGKPLPGVPVAIALRNASNTWIRWRGMTGWDGLAHVDELPAWEPEGQEVYAFPDVHLIEPPRFVLEPGVVPEEPVVLRLKETGRVVLRIENVQGHPCDLQGEASLYLAEEGESVRALAGSRFGPGQRGLVHRVIESVKACEIVFPHVELGQRFQLRANLRPLGRSSGLSIDETFAGPSMPGETKERRIAVKGTFLRMRLVDDEGLALADSAIDLWIQGGGKGLLWPGRTTTDAQAQVTLWVEGEGSPSGARGLIVASGTAKMEVETFMGGKLVRFPDPHPKLRGLAVRLDLPETTSTGVLDLGTVSLHALTPLARGRVLGEEGEPLASVRIDLDHRAASGSSEEWRPSELVATRTDEQGRFVLLGLPHGGEVRVRTNSPGYTPATAIVPEGSQDEITLRPQALGTFAGRVHFAEPSMQQNLNPWLRGEGWQERGTLEADGTFRFEGVRVGTCTFELRSSGFPCFTLEGIEVEGGRTTTPRTLDPLDLRDSLHRVVLSVVDEAGEPMAGVFGSSSVETEEGTNVMAFADHRGRIELVLPRTLTALVLKWKGHEPARFDPSLGSQTLPLRRSR